MTAVDAFAGLAPCVHCGFCLQSCPTFLVTGDESDGPRGRIVLMQALARGEIPPTDRMLVHHLDRCLGCRACEPVCPSGVSYAPALEEARRWFAEVRPVHALTRVTLALFAEPMLRVPVLAIARFFRPLAGLLAGKSRIGMMFGMLAATRQRHDGMTALRHARTMEPRAVMPSSGHAVALFRGCVMDGLFGHVNDATERVLRANGYNSVAVPGQGCCGALHAHAGLHQEAARLARANVVAFSRAREASIAVNSAGCGATLKEYGRLLAGDPLAEPAKAVAGRVRDVSELLVETGPRPGGRLALRLAYDPPCHLLHAQRIADAPVQMLDAVPGLERLLHDEAELCCGSAGSYSLSEPELSRAILQRKVEAIRRARPDVVATGNPGCIMQIGAGLRAAGLHTPVVHPVQVLDRSYAAAGFYQSTS
jgi:glycolate oxidase iron-sulfur subunit